MLTNIKEPFIFNMWNETNIYLSTKMNFFSETSQRFSVTNDQSTLSYLLKINYFEQVRIYNCK